MAVYDVNGTKVEFPDGMPAEDIVKTINIMVGNATTEDAAALMIDSKESTWLNWFDNRSMNHIIFDIAACLIALIAYDMVKMMIRGRR